MKKLTAYSTAALSFLAFGEHAQGQSVFHEFDPDYQIPINISGDRDSLDLDFDGNYDIHFWYERTQGGLSACSFKTLSIGYYGEVQFAEEVVTTSGFFDPFCTWGAYTFYEVFDAPVVFSGGIPVTTSMNWGDGNGLLYSESYDYDLGILDPNPYNRQYLAFRLPRLTDTLYGWMEVTQNRINFKIHHYWISDDITELTTGVGQCTPEAPDALQFELDAIPTLKFSWEKKEESLGCRVQVDKIGGSFSTLRNVNLFEASELVVSPTELISGTFAWRVQCLCDNAPFSPTAFSLPDSFDISCEKPFGRTNFTNTWGGSLFEWQDDGILTEDYEFQYRLVGTTAFTSIITSSKSVFFPPSAMPSGTTWEWRVKSNCAGELASGFTFWKTYTVGALRQNVSAGVAQSNQVEIQQSGTRLKIYSDETIEQVSLVDLNGRIIFSSRPENHFADVSVVELPTGIYLLEVTSPNGLIQRKVML